MVKLKQVTKPSSSDEPTVFGELSHLEDELQAHQDATSACLDSTEVLLQAKLQESLSSSLANFQLSLLAELKLLGRVVSSSTDGASASSATLARSDGSSLNPIPPQNFTANFGLNIPQNFNANFGVNTMVGRAITESRAFCDSVHNSEHVNVGVQHGKISSKIGTSENYIGPLPNIFGGVASQVVQQQKGGSQQIGNSVFPTFNVQNNMHRSSVAADLLMREFSCYNRSEYQAALARMNKTGFVDSYMDEFTKLSRRAPEFSQELLVSFFIGGLKSKIRWSVHALKPKSLYEACELARLPKSPYNPTVPASASRQQNPVNASQNVQVRTSDAEFKARRVRNQCYFCDKEYTKGHNCIRKGQLMSMEIVPSEGEILEGGEEVMNIEVPPVAPVAPIDLDELLIRLQVMGGGNSDTMQLKGVLKKRVVHMLIDFGATHNFIHPQLLKGRAKVQTKGEATVQLQLQDYTFTDDFYVLPVSGCEIVLGTKWSKSLGDILCNFEQMKMKFSVGGSEIQLQGITSAQESMISCKAMTRLLRKEREAMLVQVQAISAQKEEMVVNTKIKVLRDKYARLFAAPTSLPPQREQDHTIELFPNTLPMSVRPYRYPHFQKCEIEKIVQEQIDNGVIRPSKSPYSSPMLLVKKKDGTWRMCVDYKSLNSVTVKHKNPIPVVDELLDEVSAKIFTKLDLRSGYHQIRMHPKDIHKTAFRTHSGHYEFLVMSFGLTNAPSTFQSVMNDILRIYLRKIALVFFDDILIFSDSLDSHLEHLELLFKKLQEHDLKVKMSKCSFGVPSVEYLGHVISAEGVSVDPVKIEYIKGWKKPSTLKGLRGFLGLAGYYRKYVRVRHFAIIAKPLTDMLKLGGFQWISASEKAFEDLKQALMSTPVLALPDFNKEFVIECDASGIGIGAILSQEWHF
ncbi:PREDICTED: enzymatic polyprotein-like [Fragaria vesca subsp. vesca]